MSAIEDKNVCTLLKNAEKIAVVGLSKNPDKTSRNIALYLKKHGYEVVGVNPTITDDDDFEVYKSIKDLPNDIDIINVFRRSEDIPSIIDDVLANKPGALWLQLGIRNDEAVKPVEDAGIFTVQDQCIKVEHGNCF